MTTNRGALLLNKTVVEKYLVGYDYADVSFNYASNILTIKPVKVLGENSIKIKRTRNNEVAIMVKKNKLRNAGADISKKRYFKCIWNPGRKALIINFGAPVKRDKLK